MTQHPQKRTYGSRMAGETQKSTPIVTENIIQQLFHPFIKFPISLPLRCRPQLILFRKPTLKCEIGK